MDLSNRFSRNLPAVVRERRMKTRSSFTYSDLSDDSIRLLRLNDLASRGQLSCTLVEADKKALPEYDAISYAWNDESPTVPILCNGKALWVTPSLHAALETLQRLQHPRPIWADAICIDQGNEAEKATQVPLMGSIFSSARTVIVWLGPAGPHTDSAMERMASLSEHVKGLDVRPHDMNNLPLYGLPDAEDPVWHGIGDICTRKWFSRLWTVQEVALARHVRICCGSSGVDWPVFSAFADWLQSNGLWNVASMYHGIVKGSDGEITGYSAPHFLDRLRDKLNSGKWYSLRKLLYEASYRETREPVDKVYAILGITEPRLRRQIRVDYSQEGRRQYWKLYIDMGHLLLKKGQDLTPLLEETSNARHFEIPSWCLDYTVKCELQPFDSFLYQAGCLSKGLMSFPHVASSIDKKRIILRGITADQISEVAASSWRYLEDQGSLGVRGACTRANRWLHHCQRLHQTASEGRQDTEEVFMRCLIANIIRYPAQHIPNLEELKEGFAAFQTWLRVGEQGMNYIDHLSSAQKDHNTAFLNGVDDACRGRKFFNTSTGLIGIGPYNIQTGDKICVFRTCKMPLILRKEPLKEFYETLGPAYVQGLMDGEALEMEKQGVVEEELFEIA